MDSILVRADTRGHLNFGWLDTYHTFSFGDYINPKMKRFGALRVLNDDFIEPNGLFMPHAHNDMEIITVVLNGAVEHTDSLGNKSRINAGEIQVMCAGSGISHSEANPLNDTQLNLFQIWIYPSKKGLPPSYAQQNFSDKLIQNNLWHCLVSNRHNSDELYINQEAFINLGNFTDTAVEYQYNLNQVNSGLFLMVIEGEIEINQQKLGYRDAIMLEEIDNKIEFKIIQPAKLIAIEVTMRI